MQKKLPILPIAAGLGIVAIGGTALLLTMKPAPPAPAPVEGGATQVALAATPTPVPEMRYIANRDIPPRTVLTSDMMRRSAVSGPMPPGAIVSLDDVRGKITSKPIRSGDTITSDALISPLGRVIPANFTVPSGFRAVAVYVDPQQTAAGLVDVGDRVDVIATRKLTLAADKPDERVLGAKEITAGRTIATDLLVLAVDASLNAPPPVAPAATPAPAADAAPAAGQPAPGQPALPADAAPPPASGNAPSDPAPAETRPADGAAAPASGAKIRVLLAAPLETASRLVSANADGMLHLVVRNPLDGDAERAPETREYPGRVIIDPSLKTKENSAPSGNIAPSPFPMPDMPPVTVSQNTDSAPPMPMPVPNSNNSSGLGAMTMPVPSQPAAPTTREVMVVRGTEKTRVIVPKR